MAFTLEDGTGVTGANAYVSEAFVDNYATDRGYEGWGDNDTTAKEAAIIRASEYIDKRWGARFKGTRLLSTQGLLWPRENVYDRDGNEIAADAVPTQIQKACAEYAMRSAIKIVLAPDPMAANVDQTLDGSETRESTANGEVSRVREKVGDLESDITYKTTSEQIQAAGGSMRGAPSSLVSGSSIPEYPEADLWVKELVRSGSFGYYGRA